MSAMIPDFKRRPYPTPPPYPPVPWEQLVGAINRLSTPEVGAA